MDKLYYREIIPHIQSPGYECTIKKLGANDALFFEPEKRRFADEI